MTGDQFALIAFCAIVVIGALIACYNTMGLTSDERRMLDGIKLRGRKDNEMRE